MVPIPKDKKAIAKSLAKKRAEANKARWRQDPVAFSREALGIELWDAQVHIASDIREGAKVAVRSGHKVGKSTLLACIALWWIYTRDRGLVVLSSGNLTQVKVVLWREINRLYRGAKVSIGGEIHKDPGTGISFEDGRLVVGVTSADAERFAGFSSAGEILFLLDEASGIEDEIIETALGSLAGGGCILLCGNPTKTTGHFARVHREKPEGWSLHHISSLETPNVIEGKQVIPGLATKEWAESMAKDFGTDSAAYAVRVLGNFAAQQSDAVISLASLERATASWEELSSSEDTLEVGVDVARFGDDESCIAGKKGKRGLRAETFAKLSGLELAARVKDFVDRYRDPGHQVIIRIDDTGGYGGGVLDQLREYYQTDPTVEVVGINVSTNATYSNKFARTRDQLWWSVRKFLENGGTLPPDQRRDAELLAARYSHDKHMRILVESKDEMRKRLHRSPDRADALALACYSEVPLQEGENAAQTSVYLPPWANTQHPVLGPRTRAYEGGSRSHRGDHDIDRQRQLGAPPGGWRKGSR